MGARAGQNIVIGFNNTYVGNFVGTALADESSTIRINDLSGGDAQTASSVVSSPTSSLLAAPLLKLLLTLRTTTLAGMLARARLDLTYLLVAHLRDVAHRNSPARPQGKRARPSTKPCSMTKLTSWKQWSQLQQKLIGSLTAQVKEQAAQIQKVSAEVEMMKPAPRVVENR